jgi:hypothetical protein
MLDRNMKPVIEPGLFDIYIAASSTDIRLVETITIIDPANPDAHYSYSDSPIASRLPVTLEAGDEFIIPLRSSVGFHKYTLEWRLDSRCSYEVLLNLGGGQFTPMHRLESSGGAVSPRFKVDYEANDMMIRVVKGKGTLVNLDCQALAVER